MTKKIKEFAPGIPEGKKIELVPESKFSIWRMAIQKHVTPRGKGERVHFDLRLNPPGSSKAYSWAIPKSELPNPGEKVLAVEQPTHTSNYMNFEGNIPSGYGKGKVSLHADEKVEIVKSAPDRVLFNIYSKKFPEEYALVKLKNNDWVLLNRTITQNTKKIRVPLGKAKPKFKDADPKKIDFSNTIAMPKLDGAFSTITITPKEIRAFSYRTPKEKNKVLEYTHKILSLFKERPIEEKGTTELRAEVIAKKGKKVADAQYVAGLLNSKVWKSREDQKRVGNLQPWAFDITKYKNKDVSKLPFEERRKLLKEVIKKYKSIKLMPAVEGPKIETLLKSIENKLHPLTSEGIVLVDKSGQYIKAKFRPEQDVYIKKIFSGSGKYRNKAAGGFEYSFTPNGKIQGKVGTGFTDAQRKDMYNNPKKYIGKVARVKSLGVFKDEQGNLKSLRAPSFIDLHPEKNIGS